MASRCGITGLSEILSACQMSCDACPASMSGNPVFHYNSNWYKVVLPTGTPIPLAAWKGGGGRVFRLYGAAFASPDGNQSQWLGHFSLISNGTALFSTGVCHSSRPTCGTTGLSTMHVEVGGETLLKDKISHDNAVQVEVKKDASAERVIVTAGGATFEISAAAGKKYESVADQIKYAHLNVKMHSLPKAAAGLVAELLRNQPLSNTTMKYLRPSKAPETPEMHAKWDATTQTLWAQRTAGVHPQASALSVLQGSTECPGAALSGPPTGYVCTLAAAAKCSSDDKQYCVYDEACEDTRTDIYRGLGCNAGGVGQKCRFCGFKDQGGVQYPDCYAFADADNEVMGNLSYADAQKVSMLVALQHNASSMVVPARPQVTWHGSPLKLIKLGERLAPNGHAFCAGQNGGCGYDLNLPQVLADEVPLLGTGDLNVSRDENEVTLAVPSDVYLLAAEEGRHVDAVNRSAWTKLTNPLTGKAARAYWSGPPHHQEYVDVYKKHLGAGTHKLNNEGVMYLFRPKPQPVADGAAAAQQ